MLQTEHTHNITSDYALFITHAIPKYNLKSQ